MTRAPAPSAAFDKMATLILRHSGPKTKGTVRTLLTFQAGCGGFSFNWVLLCAQAVDTKGSVYAKLANPGSFTGDNT